MLYILNIRGVEEYAVRSVRIRTYARMHTPYARTHTNIRAYAYEHTRVCVYIIYIILIFSIFYDCNSRIRDYIFNSLTYLGEIMTLTRVSKHALLQQTFVVDFSTPLTAKRIFSPGFFFFGFEACIFTTKSNFWEKT
jgi:hypothetical protein